MLLSVGSNAGDSLGRGFECCAFFPKSVFLLISDVRTGMLDHTNSPLDTFGRSIRRVESFHVFSHLPWNLKVPISGGMCPSLRSLSPA